MSPSRKRAPRHYRFNLERHFFASPDAERAARQKAYAALAELETLKGRVTASADNLYRALVLSDRVRSTFTVILSTSISAMRSKRRTRPAAESSALAADLSKRTSFLPQELMRLDDQTLTRFRRQKPGLKTYAFAIASARRYRPHTRSLREEELLSAVEPLISDWPAELYQKMRDRTPFGTVRTGSGDLDVYTQAGTIAQHPDRAVREAGFTQLYAGYAAHATSTPSRCPGLSRRRTNAPDSGTIKTRSMRCCSVSSCAAMRSHGCMSRLPARPGSIGGTNAFVSSAFNSSPGMTRCTIWDLSVIPPTLQRPRFTVGDASDVIREALAPFGAEYARELAALLDPAHGRLDLVGDAHRLPGAFADGLLGNPMSILFSFTYEGYGDDLETLAHEAGHAVHFQLMGNHHVRPAYAHGPEYLFESFAMFNELLVMDSLYQRATDPLRRTYFLEQFLGPRCASSGPPAMPPSSTRSMTRWRPGRS